MSDTYLASLLENDAFMEMCKKLGNQNQLRLKGIRICQNLGRDAAENGGYSRKEVSIGTDAYDEKSERSTGRGAGNFPWN